MPREAATQNSDAQQKDSQAQPPLSRAGTTIGVVVDTSHTDGQRRVLLKNTVERFVRRLPEGTEACVFSAGEKPELVQECTDNRDDLTRAVRRLKTGGQPGILAGVQQAAEHLGGSASATKAIVLFTPARRVSEPNLEDAIAALRGGKNIAFSAVAGPASDWQLQEQLQRLAVKTGGFALFPARSGDMSRVAEAAASKFGQDGDAVASGSSSRRDESGRPLYTTLIVRNVAVADNPETKEFQSGDDELLQKMLIGKLQHDNVFPYVIDGRNEGSMTTPPAESHGRVLELITSIVGYRHGNRTQRRLMGAMGGASVKVNVMLRDAATGRPVQAFMEKGASSSGLFAGSNEDVQSKALKEVTENIADEVKKYGRRRGHESRENREAKRQEKKNKKEAQTSAYTLPN